MQAYTDQNTLELVGGVNPLESSATVEANNSYILVNASASSSPLTALEVRAASSGRAAALPPRAALHARGVLGGCQAGRPLPPQRARPACARPQLILQENNTLSVEGAVLDLRRSTLRAVKSNWLLFTNGSTLALGNSRLDLSDWFTW